MAKYQLTIGLIILAYLALTSALWIYSRPRYSDGSTSSWGKSFLRWLKHFGIRFVGLYVLVEAGELLAVMLSDTWPLEAFQWFQDALIAPLKII